MTSGLEIIPVRWIDDVFEVALVNFSENLPTLVKRKNIIPKRQRSRVRRTGAH